MVRVVSPLDQEGGVEVAGVRGEELVGRALPWVTAVSRAPHHQPEQDHHRDERQHRHHPDARPTGPADVAGGRGPRRLGRLDGGGLLAHRPDRTAARILGGCLPHLPTG
jgi:hypothetical protein